MRHGNKQNNLGRKKAHRTALLRNLASELILHKHIVTTLAKAKALRVFVEPLITKTKNNETQAQSTHQHRVVFSALNNKFAVKELFTTVAPKVADRPGGYTRIIKLGTRLGDAAEMAYIELVDFNTVYGKTAEKANEPAKRTRRGGKKKADGTVETKAAAPTKTETAPSTEDKSPATAAVTNEEVVATAATTPSASTANETEETKPAE